MLMERDRLSDYEKFIIMADSVRGSFTGGMQAFIGFRDILKVCQECSKSDSEDFTWHGEVTIKPVTRPEAKKMLEDFDNIRWNPLFKMVANKLNIDLR